MNKYIPKALLPCPFRCEWTPDHEEPTNLSFSAVGGFIFCRKCGAKGPEITLNEEWLDRPSTEWRDLASDAWNDRTPTKAVVTRRIESSPFVIETNQIDRETFLMDKETFLLEVAAGRAADTLEAIADGECKYTSTDPNPIISLLLSKSADVRAEATRVLSKFWPKEARDAILQAMDVEQNPFTHAVMCGELHSIDERQNDAH